MHQLPRQTFAGLPTLVASVDRFSEGSVAFRPASTLSSQTLGA
jgi:hypothetical protein